MIICIEFDKDAISTTEAVKLIYKTLVHGGGYSQIEGRFEVTKETSTLVEESYTIEEIKQ